MGLVPFFARPSGWFDRVEISDPFLSHKAAAAATLMEIGFTGCLVSCDVFTDATGVSPKHGNVIVPNCQCIPALRKVK